MYDRLYCLGRKKVLFEIQHRNLSFKEKIYVKNKIAQVSSILRKWNSRLPELSILEIKKAFLNNKILVDDPDWLIDQSIIRNFQNKNDQFLEEPLELAVLRSFWSMCKKYARAASVRVESQTGLNRFSVYEDLIQDAMTLVLHSMYYYSDNGVELSTFIGNSLRNGLNRAIRYNYCTTSPISVEDNEIKIKIIHLINKNPGYTLSQVAESMKQEYGLKDESKVRELLAKVVREGKEEEKRFLHNVPSHTHTQEDVDCLDTLNFLKTLFSPESQAILNLTKKEVELLKFGIDANFERGWQTRYSASKSLTRQRVGQIYESAVKKIRPYLSKACG